MLRLVIERNLSSGLRWLPVTRKYLFQSINQLSISKGFFCEKLNEIKRCVKLHTFIYEKENFYPLIPRNRAQFRMPFVTILCNKDN